MWTGSANAYLCAVIDAYDRDIVGDVFSDRCRAREAEEALERAVLSHFGLYPNISRLCSTESCHPGHA